MRNPERGSVTDFPGLGTAYPDASVLMGSFRQRKLSICFCDRFRPSQVCRFAMTSLLHQQECQLANHQSLTALDCGHRIQQR